MLASVSARGKKAGKCRPSETAEIVQTTSSDLFSPALASNGVARHRHHQYQHPCPEGAGIDFDSAELELFI